MLEHITIKGFMSFKDASVKLGKLNVLVGANGAGKSNFVKLFNLMSFVMTNDFRMLVARMGGSDRFLYNGRKHAEHIEVGMKVHISKKSSIYKSSAYKFNKSMVKESPAFRDLLDFVNHGYYNFLLVPNLDDSLDFALQYIRRVPYEGTIKYVRIDTPREIKNLVYDYYEHCLSQYRVYHFHDTSFTAKVKYPCSVMDNRFYRGDASNLAAYLYFLQKKHEGYYRRIVETIQLVAPFFEDFSLAPDRNNENLIRLEWKEKGTDHHRDGHSLSDGTLRFICLVVLFLQPDLPTTIIIDEPELGLHPYAITILAELIENTTAKQVIVATQSVTLLNEFTPKDIIVVEKDRKSGASAFERYDTEKLKEWVKEYSMGDIWQKNLIGGRP